ncbi:MAG: polymer-forming cytoskeletal protein [Bacteroidia bacterium]|nr:polymer-forming cytoskeletal protein [Bacteroidia bacterium]
MFKSKSSDVSPHTLNTINDGTVIIGSIKAKGDVRFDGSLEGDIEVIGKLVIGSTGHIVGQIKCKNAEILGRTEGKITVEELLTLKESAKILGDIVTNKLSVEPGVVFTGTCNMPGNAKSNAEPVREKVREHEEVVA